MSKPGCPVGAWLRWLVLASSVVLVCQSDARLAHACSLRAPTPHVLDPLAKETDSTAPGASIASVTSIERGKGLETNFASCKQSGSSCDDIGRIALQLGAQDDQTPSDKMGYQIEWVGGEIPPGLYLPSEAVRATAGTLYLHWIDGASDDQESVSFSLTVRAVDLAVNIGPAVTVEVHDSGSGGCSVVPSPFSAWPATTIAILLLARLLRRRR